MVRPVPKVRTARRLVGSTRHGATAPQRIVATKATPTCLSLCLSNFPFTPFSIHLKLSWQSLLTYAALRALSLAPNGSAKAPPPRPHPLASPPPRPRCPHLRKVVYRPPARRGNFPIALSKHVRPELGARRAESLRGVTTRTRPPLGRFFHRGCDLLRGRGRPWEPTRKANEVSG